MSKAFDLLHPTLLLAKLKAYGFSLMRSYSTDRINRTRVAQAVSSWREINRGCSQGSALRPMLWNIYQNDLFYIQLKSQLSAYADEHQLYFTHEGPEQAVKGIINDGKQASSWYNEKFLLGNLSKYQAMVISKYTPPLAIVIDSVKTKLTEDLKLLGVAVDRRLSFSEHISASYKNACGLEC